MNWNKCLIALAGLAVTSCGSSKPAANDPMVPAAPSLWSFAPSDTVAGVVVNDGALPIARQWFVEGLRIVEARAETKEIGDDIRKELSQMPIDLRDDASLASGGIDINLGAAVFVNTAEEITVVLPVSDRKAFAGLVGGSSSVDGGVEIDSFEGGEMMCKTHANRYVCTKTAQRLAMVGTGGPSKLAEAAASIAEPYRGHALMLVDAANYQLGSKLDGLDRYMTDAGTMAVSAKMERGKLTVRGIIPGTLIGEGKKLAAAPSQLVGKVGSERPSGFFRARVDPSSFPPPDFSFPGIDVKALVASLTGEIVGFARAGSSSAFSMHVGVNTPDPLRKLLAMGCDMAPSVAPFLKLKLDGSACRGTLDLRKMQGELSGMFAQSSVDLDVTVEADRLNLSSLVGGKAPNANAPSPSKLGADLLSGSWNVSLWGEGLSPIYLSELLNMGALRQNADRQELAAALWLIGHLYEGGMGVGFRDDGLHGVLEISSFAAASDEEYAGYEMALSKAVDGDFAGAQQALEALAKAHTGGLAERQVGLKSGAWIGAIGVGASMWLGRMESSTSSAPPAW